MSRAVEPRRIQLPTPPSRPPKLAVQRRKHAIEQPLPTDGCKTPQHISSPRATGTGTLEIGTRMSLSERVTTAPPSKHGLPCSVAVLLNTLEGDELAALVAMLGNEEQRGWAAGDIYDALAAEGYKVGYQSINRHRGGKCRCSR